METIAAISTATGNGGIGIIRMSGKECFEILEKIFKPINNNQNITKGYTIKYGHIIDSNNQVIDEVLVSYFIAPKSYTMENMCEINSHGGYIVERTILEECLKNGAKLAEPGEFTKRAFLNGRIDLIQAESVIDLINSKSDKEAKASIKQLEGNLSKNINSIKAKLLDLMADVEASIDYPEYDIEEVTNQKILKTTKIIKSDLEKLNTTFKNGKILREGIKTAIIGKPNAGKSSLLNTILNEERAIVSEQKGTTRDTIEEYVTIEGITLKLIDTAGIRETNDEIEKIGVKKSKKLIDDAELVIAIFDGTKELEDDDYVILNLIKDKNAIILLNKVDIKQSNLENNNNIKELNKKVLKISAKTGENIEELYKSIAEMYQINDIEIDNGEIITNIRHKQQIDEAIKSIDEVENTINNHMPIDIIEIYLKQVLNDLGKITGDDISEDIINEIFSKFCLGK
ncbi:MAG: tRNA uridine-5-carboxymethylaminomethyl(34) synthesis GTPase MnmE [Clostridia bacterium]|nr:tRNA uridine-5-carboxymethylaminomethyl(34) synthesis GTPase MnmE [Clostridia bacterium]